MDFLCTWGFDHPSFMRIHDDGREQYGGTILPPLMVLQKHASKIVQGHMLADRIGGWGAIWEPEDEPLFKAISRDRGMLKITTSHPLLHTFGHDDKSATVDNLDVVQWSVEWRIAADGDSYGYTGTHMSPSLALARMIAMCEEHEQEVRAEMLELTGGLA
jgi:hypothetical protein